MNQPRYDRRLANRNDLPIDMPKTPSKAAANVSLFASNEQFLAALNGGPFALTISKKSDGTLLEVNETFCRIVGHPREHLIGKTCFEVGILDSEVSRARMAAAPLVNDAAANIELSFLTKSGSTRLLSATISLMHYQGEECFLTFAHDITVSRVHQLQAHDEKVFSDRLIEMAQAIILVLDPEGRIIRYNPYLEKLSGYPLSEMCGKDWFDSFLPAPDRERIRAVFDGSVSAGGAEDNQNSIVTRSGEYRYISWYATVLTDPNGMVSGLLCVGHDITDRRKMEEALRVSEERFRCLFNSSFIGMVVADLNGGLVDANDAYLSILGRTREDFDAGRIRWDNITPPESVEVDQRSVAELREYGATRPVEKEYFRPDGSRVSVLGVAAKLPGPNEQAICMFVDITEKKVADAELTRYRVHLEELVAQRTAESLENQQRLHLALGASSIGMWDANYSTGDSFHDERWCNILGYRSDELPSTIESWQQRVHPDDWPNVKRMIDLHAAGETNLLEAEHRLKHKDGHWVWVLSKGKFVERDDQGNPIRMTGTIMDITHQKRLSIDGVHLLKQIESLIQKSISPSSESTSQTRSTQDKAFDALTRRQRQLLELIARGYTSAEIAAQLTIAPTTVVTHRRVLMRKLNLHSVADLTRYAIANGLIRE